MKTEFKKGDKITLNTGYGCDVGIFIRMEGDNVVWKDKDGDLYKSPIAEYKITLLITP